VTNPDTVVNEIDENGNYLLTLQHQVLTDNAAGITATHAGDSGAPVYIIKSNGAVEAYGMLIAGGHADGLYAAAKHLWRLLDGTDVRTDGLLDPGPTPAGESTLQPPRRA
jgi:hypothetical protein